MIKDPISKIIDVNRELGPLEIKLLNDEFRGALMWFNSRKLVGYPLCVILKFITHFCFKRPDWNQSTPRTPFGFIFYHVANDTLGEYHYYRNEKDNFCEFYLMLTHPTPSLEVPRYLSF